MEPLWPTSCIFVTPMSLYTPFLISQLQDTICSIAPAWGASKNVLPQLINISENATFLLKVGNEKRIIRAYRPCYHKDQEILSELLWLQTLEQENITSLPHVFPLNDGTLFTTVTLNNIKWRFAAFSHLEGQEPTIDDNLAGWFKRLGEISAKLHIQTRLWQRPRCFTRKYWTFDTIIGENAYWGDWRKAPGLSNSDTNLLKRCSNILQKAESTYPQDRDFGLIHGDLRLANIIIKEDELAIIDFDDCGFSWFGTDLANSLSFIEDHPLVPELILAWFEGYEKVTEPSKTMKLMIPHLIMMRRIQLLGWLQSHAEVPTAQKLGKAFNHGTIILANTYLQKYS